MGDPRDLQHPVANSTVLLATLLAFSVANELKLGQRSLGWFDCRDGRKTVVDIDSAFGLTSAIATQHISSAASPRPILTFFFDRSLQSNSTPT